MWHKAIIWPSVYEYVPPYGVVKKRLSVFLARYQKGCYSQANLHRYMFCKVCLEMLTKEIENSVPCRVWNLFTTFLFMLFNTVNIRLLFSLSSRLGPSSEVVELLTYGPWFKTLYCHLKQNFLSFRPLPEVCLSSLLCFRPYLVWKWCWTLSIIHDPSISLWEYATSKNTLPLK